MPQGGGKPLQIADRQASGSGAQAAKGGGTGPVSRGRSGSPPHPLVTSTQLRARGETLKRVGRRLGPQNRATAGKRAMRARREPSVARSRTGFRATYLRPGHLTLYRPEPLATHEVSSERNIHAQVGPHRIAGHGHRRPKGSRPGPGRRAGPVQCRHDYRRCRAHGRRALHREVLPRIALRPQQAHLRLCGAFHHGRAVLTPACWPQQREDR